MTQVSRSASVSLARESGSALTLSTTATWVMPAAALLLVFVMVLGTVIAKHWPFVEDAPLIHYVVFLMDHGRAPYRDIVEMNMPGTYIIQWAVMHVLGGDALGWWLWDVLSGVGAVAASAWIAGEGKRSAGVAGGAFAYISHLRDGPIQLGQRDWIVAVILLLAFGCMFEGIRKRRPAWMAGFMGLCGLAASIKPPALGFGICFLAATCWLVGRKQERGTGWPSFLLWGLGGALLPAGMVAIFLTRWGVTGDFIQILHGLMPHYAGLQRLGVLVLIRKAIMLKLLLCGAAAVFLLGRSWRRWQSNFLATAILMGAALYVLQGKGFTYHLYPELVFASLWGMLELERALRGGKWEQLVASATLLSTVFVMAPLALKREAAASYPIETLSSLEHDLNSLGGARLSGHVQCLDMTMGSCINVLYRMRLMQATGFIYDFYLFPKHGNAVTASLQARFLREVTSAPPEVIVLSSHTWPGDSYGYEQVSNWPAFENWLQRSYRLDRELPRQPRSAGYRVYIHDRDVLR